MLAQNLQKGSSRCERLSSDFADVAVWHVYHSVADIHRQSPKQKITAPVTLAGSRTVIF
ncbi:hypothetical protein [Limosilactobacillus ingluviei]|uniref:hypothetical protein n=1 Tax=Limosilactobacillus ingluviei TaxID=148604 RepID=UPI003F599EB4